ncbi:MAG TPA: HAD-IA family hydrolase [Chitinivibrionales bacterium]|nr:HAD-IA family hydrolase [Chitinivibrionales bacterium]
MKNYSHYLFDADGTLIDTTELIYQCFLYTCKKFGDRQVSRAEVIRNIGLTLRSQMEVYFGPLDNERFSMLAGEHMNYQLSIYPKYLKLFPTVREGLACLRERGRHCGIVTSRRRQTLELYLKKTGIFEFFEIFVTPENTEKHKPEPDPVLEALSLFKINDKSTVLMVGDSEFDVQCGVQAGVDTAFVNWSHNDHSSFRIKPSYLIDDFNQLCPPAA